MRSPLWPADTALSNRLLVIMPLVAIIPRCYFILQTTHGGHGDIFSTGFGFGEYTRNLFETGHFRSCSSLPFIACHPEVCVNSTRMPVMPALFAAIASIVGTETVSVAVAKCFLLATLTTLFLLTAVREVRVSTIGVGLLYTIYFGLQPLKHGASVAYEEGALLDLSLCLGIALLFLLRNDLTGSPTRRTTMALAGVILAVIMYFMKPTVLLTLVVIVLVVLMHPLLSRLVKSISVILVFAPFALWAQHIQAASGQMHWSSSWNGENLLRGYNWESARIYPEIDLDRLFDSRRAIMVDGSVVPLGSYTAQRCFNDEWEWNDYYANEAHQWLLANPMAALRFNLVKAWVALLEVRHTPTFLSATDKTPLYSPAVRIVMASWMVVARVTFFILVFLLLRDLRSRARPRYFWALLVVGAACVPYLIVFSYQRHMIPVLVMAATILVFLYMAEPRLERTH